MKAGKLLGAFLWILGFLSLLAAFAVLDWYPTVKELGRLRRERGDLERKIKDYGTMAARFEFPDAGEKALFAQSDAQVLRALPGVDVDDAWPGLARADLLERAKGLADPIVVFSKTAAFGPGPPGLQGWLTLQGQDIRQGFSVADPLYGVFPPALTAKGWLASQRLGIALQGPLPELLDFINHVSWGVARLEIVRLRMEPGPLFTRAWLVCRGSYLAREPSAWSVKMEPGDGNEGLLVDADSPLLLRRVDLLHAPGVEKKELPSAPSLRGETAPSLRGDTAGSPW